VGDSWATPGEAIHVFIIAATDTITWEPPTNPGGNALVYDVIRSPDPSDFISDATCVETDDGADTQAIDVEVPLSGGFYYLVRAQNGCPAGEGPLGDTSAGDPRTAITCP
jgi:hypothetical protein